MGAVCSGGQWGEIRECRLGDVPAILRDLGLGEYHVQVDVMDVPVSLRLDDLTHDSLSKVMRELYGLEVRVLEIGRVIGRPEVVYEVRPSGGLGEDLRDLEGVTVVGDQVILSGSRGMVDQLVLVVDEVANRASVRARIVLTIGDDAALSRWSSDLTARLSVVVSQSGGAVIDYAGGVAAELVREYRNTVAVVLNTEALLTSGESMRVHLGDELRLEQFSESAEGNRVISGYTYEPSGTEVVAHWWCAAGSWRGLVSLEESRRVGDGARRVVNYESTVLLDLGRVNEVLRLSREQADVAYRIPFLARVPVLRGLAKYRSNGSTSLLLTVVLDASAPE